MADRSYQDRKNYDALLQIFPKRTGDSKDPLYTVLALYVPINAAEFLYDAIELDCPFLWSHPQVRHDFGFDKYHLQNEQCMLVGLYTAIWYCGIEASQLREWQMRGILYDGITTKFRDWPDMTPYRAKFFKWFECQEDVFADVDSDARAIFRASLEQKATNPNTIPVQSLRGGLVTGKKELAPLQHSDYEPDPKADEEQKIAENGAEVARPLVEELTLETGVEVLKEITNRENSIITVGGEEKTETRIIPTDRNTAMDPFASLLPAQFGQKQKKENAKSNPKLKIEDNSESSVVNLADLLKQGRGKSGSHY